jgi:hypothetical protein
MDTERLKDCAFLLERELQEHRDESKDVAALADYEPLLSAIRSAKEKKIEHPIELPAMSYWYFETNIQEFKKLSDVLASFSLLLKGRDLPSDI